LGALMFGSSFWSDSVVSSVTGCINWAQ
jgi:hypothetical protein